MFLFVYWKRWNMSKENLATKNLIHDKISSFPGANGADVLLTRKEIEETSNWSFRAGEYSDPNVNYFSARKDGDRLYVSLDNQNDTGQEQFQVYDITSPSGVYIDASCRAVVYG